MLRKILKKVLFVTKLFHYLVPYKKILLIKTLEVISTFSHEREIKRIRAKVQVGKKINVVYLVMDKSVWKTDLLFQAMQNSAKYSPKIMVVPRLNASNIDETVNDTYNFFCSKGYDTIDSRRFSKKESAFLLGSTDIIFIDNPHGLSLNEYKITSIYKKLICYVPYFEQIDKNFDGHFNGLTENLAWKVYQIHDIHNKIAVQYACNKGKNIEVVGYPATEALYNYKTVNPNVWQRPELKKIIISPHHSIANSTFMSNSTFLENAEAFKQLSIKYRDVVNFAFKPHPLLKDKLIKHPEWGLERTESYWEFWVKQENTQYENGEYVDLFISSDAMIHDCSSFIIEYLYTGKPCLYLNPNIRENLNEYGKIGFDAVIKRYKEEDLENFISSVINDEISGVEPGVIKKIMPITSPTKKIIDSLNKTFDGRGYE